VSNANLEIGRKERERSGRDRPLPIGSFPNLDNCRRQRIQYQSDPVTVTSPYALTITPVIGHHRDATPGFNT
jgi:hypothetical protein